MHKSLLALIVSSSMMALAAPSLAQKESLLIGPGDLIQVDVADTPDMEQQVRVTDNGTVSLEFLGEVHVGATTPGGAANAIELALIAKQVMKHPQVTVRVEEYATQDVSVFGQVKNPGSFAITTPQTVVKLLSMAGGLTNEADREVTIKRHGVNEQVTYYLSNNSKEALSDPPMVNPGDTVLVPKAPMIYIMGDVNRPGGYFFSTNDTHLTVMQAIALAGSSSKTAVNSKVRLIRTTSDGPQEVAVRLDAIEKGAQPDIALRANDVLYVPFSWMKNLALNSASIAASTAGAAVYTIP